MVKVLHPEYKYERARIARWPITRIIEAPRGAVYTVTVPVIVQMIVERINVQNWCPLTLSEKFMKIRMIRLIRARNKKKTNPQNKQVHTYRENENRKNGSQK